MRYLVVDSLCLPLRKPDVKIDILHIANYHSSIPPDEEA